MSKIDFESPMPDGHTEATGEAGGAGKSSGPVDELFVRSGMSALTRKSSNDEITAWLRRLGDEQKNLSAPIRVLVREEALRQLHRFGFRTPAKVVAACGLGLAEDEAKSSSEGLPSFINDVEPWEEPVETGALLEELVGTVLRHVVLSDEAAVAIALWILHTHAIDSAQISPRLAILSPVKRCGKTTLLSLISALVRRRCSTANLTAAVMYRLMEAYRPTLLVDEADAFLADNEQLRGIVNSGFTREGQGVLRCEGDDNAIAGYSPWGAVAIAAIGKLPDTIMDRAIVITMQRKVGHESVEPFRRKQREALVDPARRCARWAADNVPLLENAEPHMPGELNDRAADYWEPLIAIADLAGADWGEEARRVAVALSKAGQDEEDAGDALLLLGDCRTVFDGAAAEGGRLPTKELLRRLLELEDRPWEEHNRGLALSASGLSRLLRRFGIRSTTIRFSEKSTAKGYCRADFEDAWRRYLPDAAVTAVTPP